MPSYIDLGNLIDASTLLTTLLITFLLFVVNFFYKKMTEHWKKQERQSLLNTLKIESIAYALGKMPRSFGDVFTSEYNAKFAQLARENDFLDTN